MTDNGEEAPGVTRTRGAAWRLLDRVLLHARVESVGMLARRTRRIVLTGPALADLAWSPGQNVTVFLADPTRLAGWRNGPRDLKRSYSVWDYDPSGRMELAVYDHGGETPGTSWARRVVPGDEVIVTRPEGRLVARPEAGVHLFVGEDTAAVSFGAMLRTLPAPTLVRGVIECDEEDDRLPLPRATELTWVHRRGAPAASSSLLTAALADLDLSGGEPGAAYVVGEARTCQAVRRHLIDERGWPRQRVLVRAFWTPGRRGMD
ncbi:NADPH-dependent ferric siderophore reductase, contains FAD-binding and SIP domains [Parafrankia irregularis]|uniref:NADPH-dependent ferric siderophore reductase, contains FAD-binding and SIP domains n=1 Tax=Parafrankia irregularis TaxID=795642 RepID=A0A0S4QS94_9ACTN|nr:MULTISPECIES: siderophore-interacting protein [Parafrankia]MBE3204522.1 siderophore-interacting protein [Parafrankia sp. CH37]CUU58371.1 NADPH-dependent ferric siderophore reductase, contains FAD-binding and SIP domains [Parafrankia irregularis]